MRTIVNFPAGWCDALQNNIPQIAKLASSNPRNDAVWVELAKEKPVVGRHSKKLFPLTRHSTPQS